MSLEAVAFSHYVEAKEAKTLGKSGLDIKVRMAFAKTLKMVKKMAGWLKLKKVTVNDVFEDTDQGDFESAIRVVKSIIARIPVEAMHAHFGLRVVASVACRAVLARCLGEVGRFKEAMVVGDESSISGGSVRSAVGSMSFARKYLCSIVSKALKTSAVSVSRTNRARAWCCASFSASLSIKYK